VLAVLAIAGTTLASHVVWAAPPAHPPPKPAPSGPPVGPLPMLPSIARVKIDVLKAQLVVTTEVNLPRGEWKNDALDFYVAFGAPGAPRAVDAQLLAVADGLLELDEGEGGEALVVDRAPHRPVSAHPLLGRDSMAGVVVHVKRESMVRALRPGNMAGLRVRTVLDLPDEDVNGAHGVVVRLGASRGTPLTLGRVTLTARPGSVAPTRADARLCGDDADATPLAVGIVPKPVSGATGASGAIAPVLAVRHASDDLCVRFWTQS
jgi:hypothetical protein